jgi:hypothetical protein
VKDCHHPYPAISAELGTFRCPDCGLVKRLSPQTLAQLEQLNSLLPFVQKWEPLINQYDFSGDDADAFALLLYAVVVLRDIFKVEPDALGAAVSAMYALAKLRFTVKEDDEVSGSEIQGG